MATAEEIITAPITGSRKKYKKKLWIIGLSILAVAVLGIGAYVLLPPLTPAEAAEQYIENHYDSIAEKMAYTIMPDSTIKAEIAAEIVESFAEKLIPYKCWETSSAAPETGNVLVKCEITAKTTKPVEIEIKAPMIMRVNPDQEAFKPNPTVLSADLDVERITLNGLSLIEAQRTLSILDPKNLPDKMQVPNLQGIPNPLGK